MTKKRFLAMLLTGAMTLSLAACGGTSTGSDAGTDSGADSGSDSYKIALIQQHHHIARLERFQYQFALFFFLYVCGEAFGIFQFRDNFHIEREIASRALYVVIDGCNKVLFYGSSYDEQGHFHMNY